MKLKNKDIEGVVKFLQSISPLPAQQSRKKTKFIKMCLERMKEIGDDQVELLERYGDRDDEGKLVMVGDNQYSIKEHAMDYTKEYGILINEDWAIDETESVKDILVSLRDLVLNYDKEISSEHELVYDTLCESLEQLSYE